jgi:hypothetical protein
MLRGLSPNVEVMVIDSIVNLLFRCGHRRLTRPFSPLHYGGPQEECYVVCLDCGKQFSYDLEEMRIGKPIDRSHDASVVPPNSPMPRKKKLKYALWAAVPVAVAVGVVLKTKKSKPSGDAGTPEEPSKPKDVPVDNPPASH